MLHSLLHLMKKSMSITTAPLETKKNIRNRSNSSCIMYATLLWWWHIAIFLVLLSSFGAPQTIIKNLPGFSGDLPFKLETGYVGVGDSDELQLFYYFIESERSPENDPLVLWLSGGPGCTSLNGLVYEIGPFTFNFERSPEDPIEVVLAPYSWTKLANVIFVDAPAGTGFSYSTTSDGYNTSDTIHAKRTSEFIQKWLNTHSKFLANPLYISGDSYSGKIVPMIAQELTNDIEAGIKPRLNLKGYTIGNPATNLKEDKNSRVEFAHRLALISDRIYESLKRNCKGEYVDVDQSNQLCLDSIRAYDECTEKLDQNNVLEAVCLASINRITQMALERNSESVDDNFLGLRVSNDICWEYRRQYSVIWANDVNVRRALNVREGTKGEWIRCDHSLPYTYDVQSSVGYHRNLSKTSLHALVYSGDHDLMIPYVGTLAWVESLNLTVDDDWKPWFSNNQVAGYTIYYSNKEFHLTFATIKGGGHTAPEYNPRECFDMINRWLEDSPL